MTESFIMYSLQEYPTEVLIHIFQYLSFKHLNSCRQVCLRWKEIIDYIFENESLWERQCKADFGEISHIAYHKSKSVQWRNLYRSLTLWPQLRHAKQEIEEFDLCSKIEDTVYDFQILREGLIVIHLESCIAYYDIETLTPANLPKLVGNYLKYLENDYACVTHDINFGLLIMKKHLKRNENESTISVNDVETCILEARRVYYVTRKDLCVCDLNDDKLTTRVLSNIPDSVVSVNCQGNNVYVLTKTCNVYMFSDNMLSLVENINNKDDRLGGLRKYGFLQTLDQRFFFHWWKKVIYDKIPFLKCVSIIKTYGDIVFVGTVSGVLQIYHIKSNESFSFHKEPLKEFDFKQRNERFVCIRQIDVIEGDDAHTVIVAMASKIAIVKFEHNFVK